MSQSSQQRGLLSQLGIFALLFTGMAFFGSGTPSAKIVTDVFPLFLAPFLRLLAAAVVSSPLLIVYRRELHGVCLKDWLIVLGIGAIGLVAFSLCLLIGMKMVNGVVGAVVMSMSPAAVAVGAVLFLDDQLGWRKILAVTLAVVGVLVINVFGKSIDATGWTLLWGSLLVFGAVCSQTAYSLFAKRLTKDLRPVLIVPLAAWVAVLCFSIPGMWQATDFDWQQPSYNAWFALFWWGIGPFAIGTAMWFHGLQKVKASTASGFMGAMPASALVLSYIWLGEAFHWVHMVGFALVFASIGLVSWAHHIREKRRQS
jgi:drug/metabolite transporter (DMT)-like permease